VSWWNPYAFPPGPGGREGRDEREDAGIWGGPGAPGGLHAGMVLGEGSVIIPAPESPPPVEPSEVAAGYGSVGTGVRGLGQLAEGGESAWRAFTGGPVGAAEAGGATVGTGLPDARDVGEGRWRADVAGRDPVTR
jgi:hypothetical protein